MESGEMNSQGSTASKSAIRRPIVLIIVVIALFLAMRFLPIQQWLGNFNDWVSQMGVAGIFLFIGVYAIATVLLAPGSILTIGAGFVFGLWKGFLAASAGATLGASLAFLVSLPATKSKRSRKETKSFARSTTPSANKAPNWFSCFGSAQ
jgi:uncharacterized membrane protein YdjX (TVP38/TMEM64 family)